MCEEPKEGFDCKTLVIGVLGGIVIGLVGGAFLFGVARNS